MKKLPRTVYLATRLASFNPGEDTLWSCELPLFITERKGEEQEWKIDSILRLPLRYSPHGRRFTNWPVVTPEDLRLLEGLETAAVLSSPDLEYFVTIRLRRRRTGSLSILASSEFISLAKSTQSWQVLALVASAKLPRRLVLNDQFMDPLLEIEALRANQAHVEEERFRRLFQPTRTRRHRRRHPK